MYRKIKAVEESLSIKSAKDMFLWDKSAEGISERVIYEYGQSIDHFINKVGLSEDSLLLEFNSDLINTYITQRKGKVSPNTINTTIRHIRVFLYWCMDKDYIPPFKIKLVKHQEKDQPTYSKVEIQKLLSKPKSSDFIEWRDYAAISMMVSLGTRAGTLCNIKTDDINFQEGTITYTQLKNKKIAIMPMSPQLSITLKEFIKKFDRDPTWLFCDVTENQLTVSGLRQSIIKYCKRRGVEYKGVHSFRRTFAKEFILNGGNAFILQKVLTHSTITMSAHYVNLYDKDLKDTYNELSPLDTILRK